MSAHTPGPWRHDGENVFVDSRQQVCCGRGQHECCGDFDIDGSLDQVASVTRQEDADLIAAAPVLLAALQALLSHAHVSIGDLVYAVREAEGLGWEGPEVAKWSNACALAEHAVELATGGYK